MAKVGARIASTLGELKGAAMKMGQMASMAADLLPKESAGALQSLQGDAPPVEFSVIEAQVRAEFDQPVEALFEAFEPRPFAAASIGQVHRARVDGRDVIVKVQYPGVDGAVDSDMRHLRLALLASGVLRVDKKALDASFSEISRRMHEELDYCNESDNVRMFGKFHAQHAYVRVPEVIGHRSSKRVLTLAYETGDHVRDLVALGYSDEERDRCGENLWRAMEAQIFDFGTVHADPNPANFAFRRDGTVIMYDFGCVKQLVPGITAGYRSLILDGLGEEYGAVEQTLRGLGVRRPEGPAVPSGFYKLWRDWLALPVLAEQPFDFGKARFEKEMFSTLVPATLKHMTSFQPSPELVFFNRALVGHYATLRSMGARLPVGALLRRRFPEAARWFPEAAPWGETSRFGETWPRLKTDTARLDTLRVARTARFEIPGWPSTPSRNAAIAPKAVQMRLAALSRDQRRLIERMSMSPLRTAALVLGTLVASSCSYDWSVPRKSDAGVDAGFEVELVDGGDLAPDEPDSSPEDHARRTMVVRTATRTTRPTLSLCLSPGFDGEGVGSDGCLDIDECARGTALCDALAPCANTPGAYTCGNCPVGYSGGSNGVCDDIDECAANYGGCDELASCDNIPGSHSCGACPSGYAGNGLAGCVPTLISLTANSGQLNPAFSSDIAQYVLSVDITIQTVTLTPSAPAGASVSINGTTVAPGSNWSSGLLNLGDNALSIAVAQPGHGTRTYNLIARRGFLDAYLKAGNSGPSSLFGTSVATAGGYIAIGAPWESGPAPDSSQALSQSGAVYIFRKTGAAWVQSGYLKASNAGAEDHFGSAVAISGVSRAGAGIPRWLVVGAPDEDSNVGAGATDNSSPNSGAAYVFDASTNAPVAMLKAPSYADPDDRFGTSVSAWDQWVVVGAPGDDSSATGVNRNLSDANASGSGAAFVFTCARASCSTGPTTLKPFNTGAGDSFGSSVAVSGIPSANGSTPNAINIVVGAPREDSSDRNVGGQGTTNSAVDSGAAYVFIDGQSVGQVAYLKASNSGASDLFGASVSIDRDLIVVGAPGEASSAVNVGGNQSDNTAPGSGAAYLFTGSANVWSVGPYVKASNTGAGDRFGTAVSVSGGRLLIGAPREGSQATGVGGNSLDDSSPQSGAAYTYVSSGGSWIAQGYFKASNSGAGDGFGSAVSISGEDMIIGAPNEDSSATGVNSASPSQADNSAAESGAAYVFR